MADNKVEIKVTADTAQAVGSLGAVEKSAKAVSTSTTELGGNAATAGKGLAQVGQGADGAAIGLGKARQGVQSISEQLSVAKTQIGGFIAAQLGLSTVKQVGQIADDYKNLEARIKLATGEGKAFQGAMDGVTGIAQRTNSNLQTTGNLFAKITDAGKSAGLSAQAAIAQSLGLTETINQAVQLSGASAGASNAAITQLMQGLQSGVLRGDEFNSVMEQAPRLSKAMADGLGVTTGELRKMAETGQLTADTVITALKGQADTLKNEFATLPPTLGRAIENLSTSWTLYIGDADKATGASATAASAIKLLSDNLSTVAGYLIDAGQAAAGLAALRLAQSFLGTATAAAQAGTAVVANTAALGANTAATVANNAAKTAAGGAADAAGAAVGRFAALLGTLKLFSLIGIVTNFKDIGTAIGEVAARLMGYKDRTQELAAADKLAAGVAAESLALRERGQALYKAEIDKQFELSAAAKASVGEFDKLTKEGASAAEAIGKIGKDFDLSSIPGIKNATAVLDKLAADGKLSATQFQQAWGDALKGADLAMFEVQARAALSGTAREAERLAQVMDATLREAVKRTGLDFDVISGGMGKAARSAINDTDAIVQGLGRLKAQGIDTSEVLTASIGKSINTADSVKAIEAVKAQIESLRSVLGNKVTDGLLEQAATKALALGDALDKSKAGVNSLREAMATLGITSDASLKTTAKTSQEAYEVIRQAGTSSARELGLAFAKSANDAIAANNGIAPSWVQAQAGARGYELAVDAAGKTTLRAMNDAANATDGAGNAAGRAAVQFDAMADAAAKAAKAAKATSDAREEKLKGQAATDGTGAFSLRAKQKAGTLSADDLKTAEAVMAAAQFNKDMYDANGLAFSLEGGRSINEEFNSARSMLEQVKGKQLAAAQAAKPAADTRPAQTAQGFLPPPPKQPGAPAANTTSTSNTYLVKIDLGGRATDVNVASANDAKALIDVFQQAKRAAGL